MYPVLVRDKSYKRSCNSTWSSLGVGVGGLSLMHRTQKKEKLVKMVLLSWECNIRKLIRQLTGFYSLPTGAETGRAPCHCSPSPVSFHTHSPPRSKQFKKIVHQQTGTCMFPPPPYIVSSPSLPNGATQIDSSKTAGTNPGSPVQGFLAWDGVRVTWCPVPTPSQAWTTTSSWKNLSRPSYNPPPPPSAATNCTSCCGAGCTAGGMTKSFPLVLPNCKQG